MVEACERGILRATTLMANAAAFDDAVRLGSPDPPTPRRHDRADVPVGRCTAELRAARTRLKQSRQAGLQALTAPELSEAVLQAGVRLLSFREM